MRFVRPFWPDVFCCQEEGAELYFVFEGHFHCLQKTAVVGTISPGMLFGILEVFGISDLSEDMRIRPISIPISQVFEHI